jgi:phenylpropionate dioxygenase-like ring-hydroxylating dioxygenase large terminal subunit
MPRYPDGWFQIAFSSDLQPGAVQPIKYFGREMVLFRTEAGHAKLLDAYCSHMGAHLGHGGKVKQDCVVCPFHAWEFDGEGTCRSVPYATKIPPKARMRALPMVERNGMIMAWHHGAGAAPSWELPEIAETTSADWSHYGHDAWKIRTHNQEMAENSVDIAHFRFLHGTREMPTGYAEPMGHILHTHSDTVMTTPQGPAKGTIDVHAYGFGFTTTRFTGIVETLLLSSATAIDDDHCELRFNFYVKNLVNAGVTSTVGAAFRREIARQLEQDIPIWENKIYVDPPMLCDGDGPIGVFRKWCKQFYTPSPSSSSART